MLFLSQRFKRSRFIGFTGVVLLGSLAGIAQPGQAQVILNSTPSTSMNPWVCWACSNMANPTGETRTIYASPWAGREVIVYPNSPSYPGTPPYNTGSINHSVLINPTVVNTPIYNSTLINPTVINTPYPYGSYSYGSYGTSYGVGGGVVVSPYSR